MKNLPVLTVELALCCTEEEVLVPQPMSRDNWIHVTPDQQYSLSVKMKRKNRVNEGTKAYTPKFPRGTDEGWFLTLGCIEEKELLALKRVPSVKWSGSNQSLTFQTPSRVGEQKFYC